ncbi:hypothetical protein C8Q75DRAFT_737834 [Abortiporus biennis]|nr:hypothetical protein C8Q75DRAFT_737834 [Abortiporus biennis]
MNSLQMIDLTEVDFVPKGVMVRFSKLRTVHLFKGNEDRTPMRKKSKEYTLTEELEDISDHMQSLIENQMDRVVERNTLYNSQKTYLDEDGSIVVVERDRKSKRERKMDYKSMMEIGVAPVTAFRRMAQLIRTQSPYYVHLCMTTTDIYLDNVNERF